MDEKIKDEIDEMINLLTAKIKNLHESVDGRINRLKKVMEDYLSLGNEFALGSLKTSLQNI